jgi:hypothetical protein
VNFLLTEFSPLLHTLRYGLLWKNCFFDFFAELQGNVGKFTLDEKGEEDEESRARATAAQQLSWKMTSLGSRAWVLSSVTRKSSSLSSLPNGRKSRGSASSPRLQWQPQHLLRQPQPLLRRRKRLESALK